MHDASDVNRPFEPRRASTRRPGPTDGDSSPPGEPLAMAMSTAMVGGKRGVSRSLSLTPHHSLPPSTSPPPLLWSSSFHFTSSVLPRPPSPFSSLSSSSPGPLSYEGPSPSFHTNWSIVARPSSAVGHHTPHPGSPGADVVRLKNDVGIRDGSASLTMMRPPIILHV